MISEKMPHDSGRKQKRFLVLQQKDPWASFLKAYFADLPVRIDPCANSSQASGIFDRLKPAVVFCESVFLNPSFVQKLKVRKQTDPSFRLYSLGDAGPFKKDLLFDGCFPSDPELAEFDKRFMESLPMPGNVRLLVIDDEEEIAGMILDYFEGRTHPVFELSYARNGEEGLKALASQKPDLIILDIKMPVMDGREFYAELTRRKIEVPVIIFFDSISGEELAEIRKYGNPPVVEKGTPSASLPALMLLVKKMIYFSTL